MLKKIKKALLTCPNDGSIYLLDKLSDCSGFFMSHKHLIYMVYNNEGLPHQSLATEFLRLNTNIEISSIENNQQFKSGKYNIIEIIPIDEKYDDASLDSFVNLCIAHTKFMAASAFVKYFYSLVNLFQYPKEQHYINLIGLFGELTFLKYISQVIGVDLSEHWHTSGSADKYDISLETCNIEIKTTISDNALVTIKHSQLFNWDRNFLVTVFIEENNSGLTLNKLIREMQNHSSHFKTYNFALNVEREKKRISPVDAETKKFILKSISIYDAEMINPFKTLPDNVSSITYKLDLLDALTIELKDFTEVISNV